MRLLYGILQHLRRLRLRAPGLSIAADAQLGPRLELRPRHRSGLPGSIKINHGCVLDSGVVFDAWGGTIALGPRVFVGPYTVIYGQGGVEIGEDALIGMHCRILSSDHAIPPLDRRIRWEPDVLRPTRLGRDVWLGAGVTVLGGVTIGDGCVIGAGAVVTKDLPRGSVAFGVPAVIRDRRGMTSDSPERP
jgi:acetyltransferase-like isoleucine patch superfamily enzyme